MVCSWESFGSFLTEISRAAAIGRAQVELSCIPNGEVIGSLGRYRVPLRIRNEVPTMRAVGEGQFLIPDCIGLMWRGGGG